MKIKVNGKSFEFGKLHGHKQCKVSLERACELAGIAPAEVDEITWKHKSGEAGTLESGIKVLAFEGTSFIVKQRENPQA
jgi:hypothetical protein